VHGRRFNEFFSRRFRKPRCAQRRIRELAQLRNLVPHRSGLVLRQRELERKLHERLAHLGAVDLDGVVVLVKVLHVLAADVLRKAWQNKALHDGRVDGRFAKGCQAVIKRALETLDHRVALELHSMFVSFSNNFQRVDANL
jgi:hypothetical protein